MVLGIFFKIALRLRDWHVCMWQSVKVLTVFDILNLIQNFSRTKFFLKKLEHRFLVETSKTENTSFSFKTAMSEANLKTNKMAIIKLTYHKDGSFATNYLIFLENLFQFQNLFKTVNLMYHRWKCPIRIFHKRWTLILRGFFLVSIVNSSFIVTLAWKSKVPSSSPIASYEQRWAFFQSINQSIRSYSYKWIHTTNNYWQWK